MVLSRRVKGTTNNPFGHTGILRGINAKGEYILFGANQDNAINSKAFDKNRVVCFRFPTNEPIKAQWRTLPLINDVTKSTNEA